MAFALSNLKILKRISVKRTWMTLILHNKTSISTEHRMSLHEHGKQIFSTAIQAVLPYTIMRKSLSLVEGQPPRLFIGGKEFSVEKRLHLVGFGKAVLGMAATAEEILGDHLAQGIISIPLGMQNSLRNAGKSRVLLKADSRIKVMEGARNNLPDEASMQAAIEIERLSRGLTEDDLLLVLISGGGSALLPFPIPPITLTEKQIVTRLLASRGATIQELNTVRKALSLLKGGGLAQTAYPAQVVSLILSDVIGDPLDIIASGPTIPSPNSVRDCMEVLTKYNLWDDMPSSVQTVLGSCPGNSEPPIEFTHVYNAIIGSNSLALTEAKHQAEKLGYVPVVLSTAVGGDVGIISNFYSLLISCICSLMADPSADANAHKELLDLAVRLDIPGLYLTDCFEVVKGLKDRRPLCLLAGGETTVTLRGKGKGGRNQEMALRVALELHKSCDSEWPCEVLFLSGGTDGQDGPTEAAGAFCTPQLVGEAEQERLDVPSFLRRNDSFRFFSQFKKGKHLLLTGLTGTNVMDVQVVLIRNREISS